MSLIVCVVKIRRRSTKIYILYICNLLYYDDNMWNLMYNLVFEKFLKWNLDEVIKMFNINYE